MVSIDDVERELRARIRTQLSQAKDGGSTAKLKHGARAQALSELLAWIKFQRKINP